MSEMEGLLTRIALCPDENLQVVIMQLLCPLLKRLETPQRPGVLKCLSLINKRVRSLSLSLPWEALLQLVVEHDQGSEILRNFAFVYLELASKQFDGSTWNSLLRNHNFLPRLASLSNSQTKIALRLTFTALTFIKLGDESDRALVRASFQNGGPRLFGFFFDILLYTAGSFAIPLGMSQDAVECLGKTAPSLEDLLSAKRGVLAVARNSCLPPSFSYLIGLLATASLRQDILETGASLVSRFRANVDVDNEDVKDMLFRLCLGSNDSNPSLIRSPCSSEVCVASLKEISRNDAVCTDPRCLVLLERLTTEHQIVVESSQLLLAALQLLCASAKANWIAHHLCLAEGAEWARSLWVVCRRLIFLICGSRAVAVDSGFAVSESLFSTLRWIARGWSEIIGPDFPLLDLLLEALEKEDPSASALRGALSYLMHAYAESDELIERLLGASQNSFHLLKTFALEWAAELLSPTSADRHYIALLSCSTEQIEVKRTAEKILSGTPPALEHFVEYMRFGDGLPEKLKVLKGALSNALQLLSRSVSAAPVEQVATTIGPLASLCRWCFMQEGEISAPVKEAALKLVCGMANRSTELGWLVSLYAPLWVLLTSDRIELRLASAKSFPFLLRALYGKEEGSGAASMLQRLLAVIQSSSSPNVKHGAMMGLSEVLRMAEEKDMKQLVELCWGGRQEESIRQLMDALLPQLGSPAMLMQSGTCCCFSGIADVIRCMGIPVDAAIWEKLLDQIRPMTASPQTVVAEAAIVLLQKVYQLGLPGEKALTMVWNLALSTVPHVIIAAGKSIAGLVSWLDRADRKEEAKAMLGYVLDTFVPSKKKEHRQSAAVWLSSILEAPSASCFGQLMRFQRALISLLKEKSTLAQESAVSGVVRVYTVASSLEKEIRHALVKDLVSLIQDGHAKSFAPCKHAAKLAMDIDSPESMYAILALSMERPGPDVAAAAKEQLLALRDQVIPRVFVLQFHPVAAVGAAFRRIWEALGIRLTSNPTMFKIVLEHCFSAIAAPDWRFRASAAAGISELLRHSHWNDVKEKILDLWHALMRASDDVQEDAHACGLTALTGLVRCTLRWAGPESSRSGRQETVAASIPMLLEKGLVHPAKTVRGAALVCLTDLCKVGGPFLSPFVGRILVAMLEVSGATESDSLQYVRLHADRVGLSVDDIDRTRVAIANSSPVHYAIEYCLDSLQPRTSVMEEVAVSLRDVLRGAVSLPTVTGTCKVVCRLVVRFGGQAFSSTASRQLLNGISAAMVGTTSSVAIEELSSAAAHLMSISKRTAAKRFVASMLEGLAGQSEEVHRRRAAVCCGKLGIIATDRALQMQSVVVPAVLCGRFDSVSDIAQHWNSAFDAMCSSQASVAVKMCPREIISYLEGDCGLASASWEQRRQACSAFKEAIGVENGSLVSAHCGKAMSVLWSLSCQKRHWDGKLQAFQCLSAACTNGLIPMSKEDLSVESVAMMMLSSLEKHQNDEPSNSFSLGVAMAFQKTCEALQEGDASTVLRRSIELICSADNAKTHQALRAELWGSIGLLWGSLPDCIGMAVETLEKDLSGADWKRKVPLLQALAAVVASGEGGRVVEAIFPGILETAADPAHQWTRIAAWKVIAALVPYHSSLLKENRANILRIVPSAQSTGNAELLELSSTVKAALAKPE